MDWGLILGIAATAISIMALAFAWGAVSRQHEHEQKVDWHHVHRNPRPLLTGDSIAPLWPTPENIAEAEEQLLRPSDLETTEIGVKYP